MLSLRTTLFTAILAALASTASAQAPYGQAPYGQPQYGQPQYGGESYGQPQYGGYQPAPDYGYQGDGAMYGGYPDATPIPGAGIVTPPGVNSAGAYAASVTEQLYPFDAPEPWLHGYFQEIPAYGGWAAFRPYNYRHVLSQSQAAGGWGMSPQMPYSHQFWHRYQERATMANDVAQHRQAPPADYASARQAGPVYQTAARRNYTAPARQPVYPAAQQYNGAQYNPAQYSGQAQPAPAAIDTGRISGYRRNPALR
ncbi:MAG: hypothetical protein KDA79_02895 [Planctomycetaceae bacterium]|nr:hypothetical protein [Planctomycetaceae bacterium]